MNMVKPGKKSIGVNRLKKANTLKLSVPDVELQVSLR
jgi:hypothetical protein